MTAPSAIDDAWPEDDERLDQDVAAERRVGGEIDRFRRDHRDAGVIAASRSRVCITASASASCALVLMPRTSSSPVSMTRAAQAHARRAISTASVR